MARRKPQQYNSLQGSLFSMTGGDDDFIDGFASAFNVVLPESRPHKPHTDDIEPLADTCNPSADTLLFLSFGSGSSGNCAYIGTRTEGVLIDAGVDAATVRDGLHDNGLSMRCVKGICLTHDHSDHVRYVYTLVRKHPEIGVYCTPRTLSGILRRHSISRRIKDYHRPIFKEFPFEVAGMELTAFETSHDGTDNAGFFISHGDVRFAVATDLGYVSERVDYYMRQAQFIMIEANYDARMLAEGPYPAYLKARIAAERGHLGNVECGEFVSALASGPLRHIFLCHLSKDNNTPEIALATVRRILSEHGFTRVGEGTGSAADMALPLQLMALPRFGTSPLVALRLD